MDTPAYGYTHLAARQYGIVTLSQLLEAGLTRRQIANRLHAGHLVEVHRGTYRVPGSPRCFEQVAMAATKAVEGSLLFRRGAGALYDLPGVPRWPELLIPASRRTRLPGLTVVRSRAVADEDRAMVRGIPVTSGERTLVDLAGAYARDRLRPILDHALIHGMASRSKLEARADALCRGGLAGPALVLDLLAEWPVSKRPIGSEYELQLYRVLDAAGIERPIPQYEVTIAPGQVRFLDFAWPARKLALEADSFLWHGTRKAFERDRARLQELVALGWRILPIVWGQLRHHPGEVVDLIERALAA